MRIAGDIADHLFRDGQEEMHERWKWFSTALLYSDRLSSSGLWNKKTFRRGVEAAKLIAGAMAITYIDDMENNPLRGEHDAYLYHRKLFTDHIEPLVIQGNEGGIEEFRQLVAAAEIMLEEEQKKDNYDGNVDLLNEMIADLNVLVIYAQWEKKSTTMEDKAIESLQAFIDVEAV